MLSEDMRIIIRNEDERQCFIRAANKLGLLGRSGSTPEHLTGGRMPLYIATGLAYERCLAVGYTVSSILSKPNTYEASDLFKNQLISMRRAKNG